MNLTTIKPFPLYPTPPVSLDKQGTWSKGSSWKRYYKSHFVINPPNTETAILLSFWPGKSASAGQRPLRLEFNPHKLGRNGVKWLANWFDVTFIHYSFCKLLSTPYAINSFDIAIESYLFF